MGSEAQERKQRRKKNQDAGEHKDPRIRFRGRRAACCRRYTGHRRQDRCRLPRRRPDGTYLQRCLRYGDEQATLRESDDLEVLKERIERISVKGHKTMIRCGGVQATEGVQGYRNVSTTKYLLLKRFLAIFQEIR